ncbi:hypothetical protein RchiOBHm_Chr5g0079801 [Rosa chinensis]|uniref:Uncharacterized protein n=1 Tax=Rosa chinensis TaxID=74649 RepID=A0A2P6QML6_ROSCH|nr:hypothetical protein RchiOBHm_Chr5g0079801 [Rosa chinensis]
MALSSQTASTSLPSSVEAVLGVKTPARVLSPIYLHHEFQNRGIQTFIDDEGLQSIVNELYFSKFNYLQSVQLLLIDKICIT